MASSIVEALLRVRDEASAGLNRAAGSADQFGDRAGKAGGAAGKVAGALGMISPGAADAARGLADLADVGEVAADVIKGLGPAGMIGVAGFGVLAAAAIAVVPSLIVMQREEEATRLEMELMAEQADLVDRAFRSTEDSALDLAVALGQITEAEGKRQQAQDRAVRALEDMETQQEDARKAAMEDIQLGERRRAQMEHFVGVLGLFGAGNRAAAEAVVTATDHYVGWTEAQSDAERTLRGLDDALVEHQELVDQDLQATQATITAGQEAKLTRERETAAAKGQAAAAKVAAEAAREEAEAARQLAQALAEAREEADAFGAAFFAATPDRAAEALGALDDVLDDIVPPEAISDLERLALTEADLVLAFGRGVLSLDQYTAATERLAAARKTVGEAGDLASAQAVGSSLGGAGAAIADPLTAISDADPTGIISGSIAIAQAIADLDTTLGSLTDLTNGLMEGLATGGEDIARFLAVTIEETIPGIAASVDDFVLGFIDGVPGILAALMEGAPQFAVSMLETLILLVPRMAIAFAAVLLDPATWIGIGVALAEGFGEALWNLWQDIVASLEQALGIFGGDEDKAQIWDAEWWTQKGEDIAQKDQVWDAGWWEQAGEDVSNWWGQTFDSGSQYVSRTGLAMVHRGEEIVPRSGATTQRQASARGGGGSPRARIAAQGGRFIVELDADSLYDAFRAAGQRGYSVG